MRKRPNYNWIEEIRSIPKICSNCKSPVFSWPCMYEIELNYLICESCCNNWNNWPEEWSYIVIEEYDSESTFKFFKDEKTMNNYWLRNK